MKLRALMTAICVLATANIVSAAPFAYVANSGTKNVSVIDTATNSVTATVALPDTQESIHPFAYSIAVGASGQYVYVGLQATNEVAIIDAVRNVVVKRVSLGADSPGGLAVNAAETRLYVASNMIDTLIVINISGSGSSELARIKVDDATISNPNGVVLNSAGTRAFVASTMTGNVAEISIDETNNLYSRLSVTSLGSNVQPVGLAINSAGTKLYVSSLSGAVKMINIATKAVTSLAVGTGTVTVAINKADNTKVYAPSNTLDKLYVINSDVVSGTQYDVAAGPYSGSVTPDGSKLYLTMNTSSAGETVKVFNTSTNTVDATIQLPTLAKPTSMGDFVGPELPYTITSSASGNCSVSPEGAVHLNSIGSRKFTVTATSPTTCDVRLDGNIQQAGVTTSYDYTFSNVIADHTFTAFAAGLTFNVTADWTGEALGCLEVPFGSGCATKLTPIPFSAGSNVIIKANSGFKAESWTGDCAGTVGDTCTLKALTADKTVGANIVVGGGPIYNVTKNIYYQTFAAALAAAATSDQIKLTSAYTSAGETTTAGGTAVTVKLSSGWDINYTTPASSKMPPLTIGAIGIVVDPATGYTLTL